MRDGLPPTENTTALDGTSSVELSSDGIIAIHRCFHQNQSIEQFGLTFPELVGELPGLTIGTVRETQRIYSAGGTTS